MHMKMTPFLVTQIKTWFVHVQLRNFNHAVFYMYIIFQIFRIQNKTLYQQYEAKKNQINNQNPPGHQNEQKPVWHGTRPDAIDSIMYNGFNRSYCSTAPHSMYFKFLLTFNCCLICLKFYLQCCKEFSTLMFINWDWICNCMINRLIIKSGFNDNYSLEPVEWSKDVIYILWKILSLISRYSVLGWLEKLELPVNTSKFWQTNWQTFLR